MGKYLYFKAFKGNFDFINNTFINRRKNFKDFTSSLNDRYKCDLEYAKGMKKIYESNSLITNIGTLSKAMMFNKDHYLNLYNYHNEFASNLKSEIIEPAKKFLESQLNIGKILFSDIKRYEKDFKDALSNLEKSKTKFLNLAKTAEIARLDSEMAKTTPNITPQDKDKFFSKSAYAMKELKEAEINYINNIKTANYLRLLFIDGSRASLLSYQLLEEELIEYIKILLRKLFIYANGKLRNSLYDLDKIVQEIESIDMNKDITDFIKDNQTNISLPLEIEYVPYNLILRNKPIVEQQKYPPDVVYNVIIAMYDLLEKNNDDVKFI